MRRMNEKLRRALEQLENAVRAHATAQAEVDRLNGAIYKAREVVLDLTEGEDES